MRRSYPESPPRVEYELTDKGRALLPIIREMRKFGHAWIVRGAVAAPPHRRAPLGRSTRASGVRTVAQSSAYTIRRCA